MRGIAQLASFLIGIFLLLQAAFGSWRLATVVFLDLNRSEPDLSDDAAFQLVMDVAAGSADVEGIADRLRVVPR